ncbi:MAG: hypothetical protein H6Q33_1183, partial [Deltaproteobacteria bacterium]|nr:hypothetical protein [Deltaproteobacteria bacterium]
MRTSTGTLWRLAPACVLTAVLLLAAWTPTVCLAGTTVGTGSPDSCTEQALDAALAGGGSVTFDCGGTAVTITLTTPKTIALDTSIDGGALITLSGGST